MRDRYVPICAEEAIQLVQGLTEKQAHDLRIREMAIDRGMTRCSITT